MIVIGRKRGRWELRLRMLFMTVLIVMALILSANFASADRQNPALNWGNTTVMDAPIPPPGLYLSNYMVYYTANKLMDGDGEKIKGNYDIDVLVYTPQLIYVAKSKIAGLSWGWQALVPLINYTADGYFDTPGAPWGDRLGISDFENNDVLGDLCFGPYIGGVVPFTENSRLHWFFDFDIYAPIGSYDKKKALNPGYNAWTLEPFLALTLQLPYGINIGTRQHFTYNFKNDDYVLDGVEGKMKGGMLYHFNYDIMKTVDFISPNLQVSLAGYYGIQLNEDEFEGDDIKDSKMRKFAIGPAIWYLSPKGLVFSLRAYWEDKVKNNPEGQKVVARIIIPF